MGEKGGKRERGMNLVTTVEVAEIEIIKYMGQPILGHWVWVMGDRNVSTMSTLV